MKNFCDNCGTKLNEGEKFCPNCGASIEETEAEVIQENVENNAQTVNMENNVQTESVENNTQTAETVTEPQKTNGMAIAGFVCSLGGILIAALPLGIIAICLSVAGKKRISALGDQKGKGLAIAGLVIGIVDVVFGAIGVIGAISSNL